ncbi:amino acid permease family protein [Mycobacterium ulcerans str. Harvey]|uniref:Amino acid permease family protein n=1 Tax=Mycobacterium ulcerans str. Harvey TaxID=1299332 RepID=A0ABN0R4V3_MYCUL|nr:amino acid permease family protein [Mycobacterium ulcerans str. Harvey]
MIAIGGAIGTGLFMGSGRTISLAGPAVIVVYAVIGFFVFFVLRAMGELLLSNLNYKSFVDCAADLLGPAAGYFMGWSYWFAWIVAGIADLVAITGYSKFWWPDVPTWAPALVTIAVMLSINMFGVSKFGETEFWFALIKVAAILCLITVARSWSSPASPRPTATGRPWRISGTTAGSSQPGSSVWRAGFRSPFSPISEWNWWVRPRRKPPIPATLSPVRSTPSRCG